MDPAHLLSTPAEFAVISPDSFSSSSSSVTEDDVNRRSESRFTYTGNFNRTDFPARGNGSIAGFEQSVSCFAVVLIFWLFVSMAMIVGVYGPKNVWIGPNSSIFVEPNPVFVQSVKVCLNLFVCSCLFFKCFFELCFVLFFVKVKELDSSKSGLELFGFYRSLPPSLDVVVNWSESRFVSVSHNSYKGWPFYLNKGASLNISYNVKPNGSSARLVVDEGMATHWLLEKSSYQNTALSWNSFTGSGVIEVKISKPSSYFVTVSNSNIEDIEVELDIDVKAVLYDTKHSFYKCNFNDGECTFNALSLSGNSLVLTSQAPRQGASVEEEEWYIRFTYEPRWVSYIISTGFVTCFMLGAIQFWKRLQCHGGEETSQTENDAARTRLVPNKDEDGSSIGSSNESFAADDADMEEFVCNEGEASNSTRRLCAICFDAPRDCFFLPCGHCVSCYQCGTKISEAAGSCPICRRIMKKVKRIYTV
ncbi:unnamed protein product [Cochlearia groenlandica]